MKKIFYSILALFIFGFSLYAADEVEALLGKKTKAADTQIEFKPSDGVVLGVKGQVFLRYEKEQTWKQVLKGDKVKEKAIVITMDESEVTIKLLNETNTTILSKSRVYFTTLRTNPKIETINETELKIKVGKIYSNVKKSLENGSRYEIKTSSATAGVRGTQFTVTANENGESSVSVYKGLVAFGSISGDAVTLVKPNEKITLNNKGVFKLKEENKESQPKEIIGESDKKTETNNATPDLTKSSESTPKVETIDDKWIDENFGENIDIKEEIKKNDIDLKVLETEKENDQVGTLTTIIQ